MHQPLLERMLAKDPKDRFQSAAELCASITR
jgi:serine/threonine protein kinase